MKIDETILKIPGLSAANSNMLRDIIRYYNIEVNLSSALKEITAEGVRIAGEDGEKFIAADNVILSVGYKPEMKFDAEAEGVTVIGDAAKVGNLLTVVRDAYNVAYAM